MRRLAEILRDAIRHVVRFFRFSWKFILLTTLLLSLLLIPLLLLLPPLYTRDVTITVTPTLTELQKTLGQEEVISSQQIGNGAATFLRQGKAFDDEVLLAPVYKESSDSIEVHMESENRPLMQTMDSRLVDLLETNFQRNYEKDLSSVVEATIQTLDSEVTSSKDALAEIEREIEEASRSTGSSEADTRQFEERRASAAANLVAAEDSKDYYEQARRNLPAISDQAVSVRLVAATPVRPKGTRGSTVAAAFLLAFVVAIAGALRMGYARGK